MNVDVIREFFTNSWLYLAIGFGVATALTLLLPRHFKGGIKLVFWPVVFVAVFFVSAWVSDLFWPHIETHDYIGVIEKISDEELVLDGNRIRLTEETQVNHQYISLEGGIVSMEPSQWSDLAEGKEVEIAATQIRNAIFADEINLRFYEQPMSFEVSNLYSRYALLMEPANGRILMDVRGEEKMFPASMTKIVSVLVAIENLESLDEYIFIDPGMFAGLWAENATLAGFAPDTWVGAKDVLHGIMLPSGAEATLAMAEHVGGSIEGFVQLMNEKVAELGLTQTHFTNPIGLHDDDHYTTPADLAAFLAYALQNPMFREVFTAKEYRSQVGILGSTLWDNISRSQVTHGEILGGRTGFTFEAGRCMISLAVIDGREYILVTGGAENAPGVSVTRHLQDALNIYDQVGAQTPIEFLPN